MIRQQSGDTVMKYFDRFKSARVNVELSKGNLIKHKELEKSERDDGNNTNPGKSGGRQVLAMDFLECADLVRHKNLWSSLRNNYLTDTDRYPNTLTDSFNLLSH